MLEQIVAFLVSLAVGAAGAAGLHTATTQAHGVGTPEIADARAELAQQEAAARLAAALETALAAFEEAQAQVQGGHDVDAADGTETATTAITGSPAWDASGGAADEGLGTALTAVEEGAANGDRGDEAQPEDVPPVTPPTAPPTAPPADAPTAPSDLLGGRP